MRDLGRTSKSIAKSMGARRWLFEHPAFKGTRFFSRERSAASLQKRLKMKIWELLPRGARCQHVANQSYGEVHSGTWYE
jgi:hypothetical protein